MQKKIFKKLKDRYRLIIYNDSTFQSVWSMKLSRLKVFTITSLLSAIIVILVILLIATTGLREYIPGFPGAEYRQILVRNALIVDSLEVELQRRDEYLGTIKTLISGGVQEDYLIEDTIHKIENIEFYEFNHDSVFQDRLMAEQTSLMIDNSQKDDLSLSQIHFFAPVKGMITDHFDLAKDHFGVDLVSGPNSRVSAVLDGTVIFSGFTLETGYVIYVQHHSDLISVYMHNSELLKSQGDKVKAGEAIAFIGNTGELSTGPHLHFEIWYRGNPLDPEQYIGF